MNHADTVALLKSAHKAGFPPIHFSVFSVLLWHTNWRGTCHPGIRTIAKLCSINKDTVTASVKILAQNNILTIHTAPRKVNVYEILAKIRWEICPVWSDTSKSKLSGPTAQMAVRSGRTANFAKLHVNCPVPSDVSKGSPQGANGIASQLEEIEDEASPTVNGHKIAFG